MGRQDKEAKAKGGEGRPGVGDKRLPRATRRPPPRPTRPTTASGCRGRPHALGRQVEESGQASAGWQTTQCPLLIGGMTGRYIPRLRGLPPSPLHQVDAAVPPVQQYCMYVLCRVIVRKYLVQDDDSQRLQPICFCPPGEILLEHFTTSRGMGMRLLLRVMPLLHLCQSWVVSRAQTEEDSSVSLRFRCR